MKIGDHPRTPTSANQFKTFLTLEVSPSARLLALKKLQIVCRSRHSRMLTPIALRNFKSVQLTYFFNRNIC